MKKWLLIMSVDGIDIDAQQEIISDSEPSYWVCAEIAEKNNCEFWYIDEVVEDRLHDGDILEVNDNTYELLWLDSTGINGENEYAILCDDIIREYDGLKEALTVISCNATLDEAIEAIKANEWRREYIK